MAEPDQPVGVAPHLPDGVLPGLVPQQATRPPLRTPQEKLMPTLTVVNRPVGGVGPEGGRLPPRDPAPRRDPSKALRRPVTRVGTAASGPRQRAPPPVGEVPAALPNADPSIGEWYAAPAQVFDDLYFLGQTVFSVWALRTSEGFILVDAIFDLHYQQRVTGDGPRTTLLTNTEVRGSRVVEAGSELDLLHTETGESFSLRTGGLVLATGYGATEPAFLEGVADRIRRDPRGRYDVADDYSVDVAGGEIFVQNAEEHTHSLLAPDLGMGPYRNSVIIAAMLGREAYPVEKRIAVQTFGVPDRFRSEVEEVAQRPSRDHRSIDAKATR